MSNVHCEPDTVDVCDSAHGYIDSDTKLQICSFLRTTHDVYKLRMQNIQCQVANRTVRLWSICCTFSGERFCVTGTQPR